MKASREEVWLDPLNQAQIDGLLGSGVEVRSLINPTAVLTTTGYRAADGRFEYDPAGKPWLAFEEADDFVFWRSQPAEFATYAGRAFALGQGAIDDPATYSFDCSLNLFSGPLEWLRARRDGCVVLDWPRAFDRLRDCPRVAVTESLRFEYRRWMKPPCMPDVLIIPERRAAA